MMKYRLVRAIRTLARTDRVILGTCRRLRFFFSSIGSTSPSYNSRTFLVHYHARFTPVKPGKARRGEAREASVSRCFYCTFPASSGKIREGRGSPDYEGGAGAPEFNSRRPDKFPLRKLLTEKDWDGGSRFRART